MNEDRARNWDTAIKVVGILLAVAGFWDGVRRFNQGRQAEAQLAATRAREAQVVAVRESRKPFLERQLALYFEAAKAASQLATLPQGTAWNNARQRFWELYWGELGLVEDADVQTAMVNFGRALNDLHKGAVPAAGLDVLALRLAHACRNSLREGWGKLDTLPTAGNH